MKAKIYRNIQGKMIAKRVPPVLREQVLLRRFEQDLGEFTLLVFSVQKNSAIFSGAVNHVLGTISCEDRIIACGGCFTLESLTELRERKAEIFTASDFPWTDDGVQNIRAVISSPVKYPPV